MGWISIRISREELFEKVWAQPTTKLAQEFGISDVALGKICKKLNIPRPPQGYWLRKSRKGPPALPRTKGPTEHHISKWIAPEHELNISQKTERENLIDQEKLPENFLQVGEEDEELHRLVARTQKQLLKAAAKKTTTDRSWVKGRDNSLDVRVSPPLINRAIRIMNALVVGLEKRKYAVTVKEGRTCVSVLGEYFGSISKKHRLGFLTS